MKPFSRKPIIIFSIRSVVSRTINPEIQTSHFSTSSHLNPQHHQQQYHSSHSSRRQHDEDSRNVRVSVWWDFENCHLPANANVFRVTQSITAAVRANGIKGPIQITAFGDVVQLSRANQEALSATGITLTHIPRGGKNSADRSLLVDLMYWVSQNPPPAHLFLISGDRDFSSTLHRLRMNNYNILLATSDCAPGVLCSSASIMWQWDALVRGDNLAGKHFNQPPDGPYNSWYGHSRAPIEDPFAVCNKPQCSQQNELAESKSEPQTRPIPKAIVNVIRNILKTYPEGLSITTLRQELARSDVTIDKDLYGHKKFSKFLLSMPHVLKLERRDDGQIAVFSTTPKVPELSDHTSISAAAPVAITKGPESSCWSEGESSGEQTPAVAPGPSVTIKDSDSVISYKANVAKSSYVGTGNEKSSVSPELNAKKHQTEFQEPVNNLEELQIVDDSRSLSENVRTGEDSSNQLHPTEESKPTTEAGFFKRIWRKWFGGKGSNERSSKKVEMCTTSEDSTEVKKAEVKCEQSSGQSVECESLPSSPNEGTMDKEFADSSAVNDDKNSKGLSFFNRIMTWCKSPVTNQHASYSIEECSDNNKEVPIALEMEDVFSESLWSDVLAFLISPKGSDAILKSRTRQEMVQNLQKRGPSSIRDLGEKHLLYLVDLLVTDKRWVEECPSQRFPFRLVLPAGESNSSGRSKESVVGSSQQPELGEKSIQNHPHSGISLPTTHKKPMSKSRSQVLNDCQKLVNELMKEHPDGFNIGKFRKLFLDRYGYSLEVQKLGYQKLATLLQIMPDVKIELNNMIPSRNVSNGSIVQEDESAGKLPKSDRPLSIKNDDDLDLPWKELGPIAKTNTRVEDRTSLNREIKEANVSRVQHEFEMLSDNDSSDSEGDGSERRCGPSTNNEDSSLLQILDSWYSTKEENSRKADKTLDNLSNTNANLKPSSSAEGVKDEAAHFYSVRKQRPPKQYSFVVDNQAGDSKEKLIDGILGSLKKSGDVLTESRMQS